MKEWLVVLEGKEVSTIYGPELKFIDLRYIIGEFRRVKGEILVILTSHIEKYGNYHIKVGINRVVSPEQQEINKELIIILLGISKDGSKYGFLIARTNGYTLIIGVWPESYAENVKKSERAFREKIIAMVNNPENWERVDIIVSSRR